MEDSSTPHIERQPPRRRVAPGLKRPGRAKFFKTPKGRALAARFKKEYTGRSQPKNLGRTGPGRRGAARAVITDWDFAKLISRGRSPRGMQSSTASARSKSLGLNYGTSFFSDQGEPFTDGDLQGLRTRCGFAGAHFETLTALDERSGDARHARMIRDPRDAEKVVTWRDTVLRTLLQKASNRFKVERVLRTLLPDLGRIRRTLLDCFTAVQTSIRQGTACGNFEQLGDLVSAQAKLSAKSDPHAGSWGTMLRYLGELSENKEARKFLDENLLSLPTRKVWNGFVEEIIAQRLGTTRWTVGRAVLGTVKPIPAEIMCGLILTYATRPSVSTAAKEPTPTKAEPTPTKTVEQTSSYKLAQALSGILSKCREALTACKAAQRFHPGDRKKWESVVRQTGFNEQREIDEIITSKLATAAAAAIIALRRGISKPSVQNAWSKHKRSFS